MSWNHSATIWLLFKSRPVHYLMLSSHISISFPLHWYCALQVLFTDVASFYIGVNRPAIVREFPRFGLFPAFSHFCENVQHFWLYIETTKIAENRNHFSCTETFCSKISAKTSMSPSCFWLKNMSKIAENRNNCHCRRHFVRKSAPKTSMISGNHLVQVPQDVDVVNSRWKPAKSGERPAFFSVHVDCNVFTMCPNHQNFLFFTADKRLEN